MHRTCLRIASIFFRRWIASGKTWFGFLMLAVFSYLTYEPLNEVVSFLGTKASPWIFNFLLSHDRMLIVFLGISMILYSDTFLVDRFSLELTVRVGRRRYITGQILFVVCATAFVCIVAFFMSIVFVLPSIRWDSGWGTVIYTIAESPSIIKAKTGIEFTFILDSRYLEAMSPVRSTLYTLLFMWLSQIFIAGLIGSFRVFTGRNTGIAVAGVFAFISPFSRNIGQLIFGTTLYYLSPATWTSPLYLNWYGMKNIPTPLYAGCVLGGVSFLMFMLSYYRFQQKDLWDQEIMGG